MINGKTITLSGREFVAPPVNWATFKQFKVEFAQIQQGTWTPDFDVMGTIILQALQRNYPELTEAELGKLLDIANIGIAFSAVMNASGFEDHAPGEAPAAVNPSTGTN